MNYEKNQIIEQLDLLVSAMQEARDPIDFPIQISTTMFWSVDYKNRKHLYIWSPFAITLTFEDYGSQTLNAGQWYQADFPAGMHVTSNNTSPIYIYGKATDEYIVAPIPFSINAALTLNGATISPSNPLPITDVGGAVALVEVSTTIAAAASGTLTLPGVAGKTTYIRGFTITGAAVTAIVSGLVTITGLTNPFNFYYDALATGQSILQQYFGEDGIPASAVNTAIVINFPAITGGSTTALNAWGYQL